MLENLTPRVNTPSKIDLIKQGLDPKDRALLDIYLQDVTGWSPNQLSYALSAQGINISGDTIRRYRLRQGYC